MVDPPAKTSREPLPAKQQPAPRYQPLVVVLAAVCLGVVVDRVWPPAIWVWWVVVLACWPVWLMLWRRGRQRAAAICLLAAVAAAAGSWHHCRWFLFAEDDLGYIARSQAQPVCVEAVARCAPRLVPAPPFDPMRPIPLGDRSELEIELTALRNGSVWQSASGRAKLSVYGDLTGIASGNNADINAGDRLRVFAMVETPSVPDNPGQFDYAAFSRAKRQRSRLLARMPECVAVVRPEAGWNFWHLIDRTRSGGRRVLDRYLDPRRADLADAVLLGARGQLDPDQKAAFVETGMVHLLAISGLHVGILAGFLVWLARRLAVPRHGALWGIALAALFYMLLTDARSPVNRATVFVVITCVAMLLKRTNVFSFNTLAAAALIILAWNPVELFQSGFQLSFLAVAGLLWFAPWIRRWETIDALQQVIELSESWPRRALHAVGHGARTLALVGLTIWLLSLPLVMARFNLFAPVGLVLNVVLWIPMSIALISGFLTLVIGSIAPVLGFVPGFVCDQSLAFLQMCVTTGRDVPGSHFWVPGPSDWWLAIFYSGLGVLAAFRSVRPPLRWCVALLAGWTTVGFAAAAWQGNDERLVCTVLSTGHGCATVLELPSGQTLLYDAGQLGSPLGATRSIAGLLWSRGITHLDAVVLSHPDIDHYNALPGLLERFSVGAIYVSPVMFDEDSVALRALHEAIERSGVPLHEIHSGNRLAVGSDCLIEVLHPTRFGVLGGDNAGSIVLKVEYRGRCILLPGDLESPGLDDMLAEEPTPCDILLAPHHGSRRSNPPGLAQWCTPRCVIVSGTMQWNPREVEAAYKDVGSQVYHTAETGAVEATIDASGVRIRSFNERRHNERRHNEL